MYCKHCGTKLGEKEKTCESCGFTRGHGSGYCPACGRKIPFDAEECPLCGSGVRVVREKKPRSRMAAGLLGVFLGCFGFHNLYLGYIKPGLFKLILSLVLIILGVLFLLPLFFMPLMICWGMFEGLSILLGRVRVDARGEFLK